MGRTSPNFSSCRHRSCCCCCLGVARKRDQQFRALPESEVDDDGGIWAGAQGEAGRRLGEVAGTSGVLTPVAACSQSIWLILLSLNALGPFSSDVYLPNLPDIERDLRTTRTLASATIQVNWIVLGTVNPVIGGLSDRHGRKAVTIATLAIFVCGAVGSALSQTLAQLMAARVVMGVGQAVSVISTAVIRDLVDDTKERMRIMGFFSMMQPIMILSAPSVGGFIGEFSGWRLLFWLLAGWGAMIMVLMESLVPETNKSYLQRSSLRNGNKDPVQVQEAAKLIDAVEPTDQLEYSEGQYPRTMLMKLHELFGSVPFTGLTLAASAFMAAVRAMLCVLFRDFKFWKSGSVTLRTAFQNDDSVRVRGSLLPQYLKYRDPSLCANWMRDRLLDDRRDCREVSRNLVRCSMMSFALARVHTEPVAQRASRLLRHGMCAGLLAPVALGVGGWFYHLGWGVVVAAVAVMSATGFFVLPAMQVT
eukprot:COSAG01_NODE_2889_length_6907_cov_43.104877_1_plen_476_part_00